MKYLNARSIYILCLCIFGILVAIYCVGADTVDIFTKLRSANETERETAAKSMLSERERTINEIEKIFKAFVENTERKGTAKTAITLLGQMHSASSVSVLVDHLSFEVFYKDSKRPQTVEDRFPCVGALIQIGVPSLEPTLRRAEISDDATITLCAATVFHKILGGKLALAYILDKTEHEADPVRQQRLQHLRQQISQLH